MSDSKRQNILAQIVTILESLSSLKHVENKKITPVDTETCPMPAAFIFSGAEQKLINDDRSVIGYENWLWKIFIEVWARDADTEALLKEIHDVMWTNRNIGGYAVTSDRMGVSLFVVDVEQSIEAMILDYDILYRNVKGIL
jgi:hypothetical protein